MGNHSPNFAESGANSCRSTTQHVRSSMQKVMMYVSENAENMGQDVVGAQSIQNEDEKTSMSGGKDQFATSTESQDRVMVSQKRSQV